MDGGTDQPRVLHLWPDYVPGHMGDPHQLLLDRTGWRSEVLALRLFDGPTPPGPDVRWLQRDAPSGRGLVAKVRRRLAEPLLWRRFRRRSGEALVRADLVHAHFGTTGARVTGEVDKAGVPSIVTFYGVDGSAAVRDPAWQTRYRTMLGQASRVVVLCEAVKDRLVELGADPDAVRIWRIPPGVEHYTRRHPQPGARVRFLTAARFVEKKGHPYLLQAFAELLEEGLDAELTLLGFGPLRAAVEQQVADLGLGDRVRVVDTAGRDDFHELYDAELGRHDVFVLPSVAATDGDDEGGPALTLVLAQAAGLPVICTAFPGAELSVVDGVTGRYCAEGDVAALKAVMAEVAGDPASWERLGSAASDLVRRDFSVDGQFEALLQIYREALEVGAARLPGGRR